MSPFFFFKYAAKTWGQLGWNSMNILGVFYKESMKYFHKVLLWWWLPLQGLSRSHESWQDCGLLGKIHCCRNRGKFKNKLRKESSFRSETPAMSSGTFALISYLIQVGMFKLLQKGISIWFLLSTAQQRRCSRTDGESKVMWRKSNPNAGSAPTTH